MLARCSIARFSSLVLVCLVLASTASAQSLTGTWDVGSGSGRAKCRTVLVDGTSSSGEYVLGPLEITQAGSLVYVRSFERALRYQGVVHLASSGSGSALATSCDAVTATAADVPGTFYFSKVSPVK